MTSMLPVLLTTLWLAGQAPATGPIRLGPTAHHLTNDDLEQTSTRVAVGTVGR